MFVYTVTGKKLELKEPPLGKGGEGSVYAIQDYDKRVAKIYKENADAHKEKIEAMASCSGSFLHDVQLANLAWPLAALYEDPKAEKFAGFGMRRIPGGRSLEEAYDYPPQLGMDVPLWQKLAFFQNGAELMDGYLDSDNSYYNEEKTDAVYSEIKSGVSVYAQQEWELRDTTSPVEITITELNWETGKEIVVFEDTIQIA